MSEIEREPCPRCGEPAALSGRVCPHCQGSLLVNVVLDAPVADPRARYQLARSLSSLGPPAPPFSAANQALAESRPVLARGLTRTEAHWLLQAMVDFGLRGRAVEEIREERHGRAPLPKLALAGAAAAVILVGALLLFRTGDGPRSASPPEGTILQPSPLPTPVSSGRPARALSAREVAALATPSTVVLRNGGSLGSGFFVAEDLVLTNAHVIASELDPVEVVFSDGRQIEGRAVERNEELDLALVRAPGAAAEPLPLGDATALDTGDRVIFIGTPRGLDFTVHEGIVSHAMRQVLGVGYLQIDANVNPGNSGGPVLDTTGRVVGVLTAKVEGAQGLGLALPINYTYEGDPALLERPEPRPDSAAWQDLLAQVREEDRRAAEDVAMAARRPILVSAMGTPRREEIVVSVARLSDGAPISESLFFTFRKPGRMLCSVTTSVETWRKAGRSSLGDDPRLARWLEDKGVSLDVYQGFAALNLRECPLDELSGSEMVLEGADEGADRIQVP
jgi:serine protease Do